MGKGPYDVGPFYWCEGTILKPEDRLIINPVTGDHNFGFIPALPAVGFEAGPIHLKEGFHRGPPASGRGFGLNHIWTAHSRELAGKGVSAIEDIPAFVTTIILPGTPLFCEFNDLRGNHRLAVLRSRKGLAIIERKIDGENITHYSVVTVFTNAKANGTLVGAVVESLVAG